MFTACGFFFVLCTSSNYDYHEALLYNMFSKKNIRNLMFTFNSPVCFPKCLGPLYFLCSTTIIIFKQQILKCMFSLHGMLHCPKGLGVLYFYEAPIYQFFSNNKTQKIHVCTSKCMIVSYVYWGEIILMKG